MYDKESIKITMRKVFETWTEEELENYATMMANKYSTIKRGDNVVHLEYFSGIIDNNDIQEIENILSSVNLELSRFDKNGVPSASMEEFALQLSLCLKDPLVQMLLQGLATNALWDTLKTTAIFIWKRVKNRRQYISGNSKLNFGLRIRTSEDVEVDLKLDTESSEPIVRQALDKVVDLIKKPEVKEPSFNNFYIFDEETRDWKAVNLREEILKMALKKAKKEEK